MSDARNNDWTVTNAFHVNRHTDAFDWAYRGKPMLHERATFPWSPFKSAYFSYWPDVIYTDVALAKSDADAFGGSVAECFYCDPENPTWFVEFNDFEKAADYCEAKAAGGTSA